MSELHPQLEKDCVVVGRFHLCRLLLMKDANYPWFILVPDREGISEIHQLGTEDQMQLMSESVALSRILAETFNADKMNIAALGNVVPQLHVHHVVRYRDDAAWPAPVWGRVEAIPYSEEDVAKVIRKLKECMPENFEFTIQSEGFC